MGYPTKVQLIERDNGEQWYITVPSAVARSMDFERGEVVEWHIESRSQLLLTRLHAPPSPRKKKPRAR